VSIFAEILFDFLVGRSFIVVTVNTAAPVV
jgi:hypothetical protein